MARRPATLLSSRAPEVTAPTGLKWQAVIVAITRARSGWPFIAQSASDLSQSSLRMARNSGISAREIPSAASGRNCQSLPWSLIDSESASYSFTYSAIAPREAMRRLLGGAQAEEPG